MWMHAFGLIAGAWLAVSPAWGQFVSGSDESDGALNITANTVIDLRLAADAPWDTPSPVAGQGVYDPVQWAVVYKYSTIDVAAGATVTFLNHEKGAPVVWLATGDVTVAGVVSVNGTNGGARDIPPITFAEPGPGGFAGGQQAVGVSTTPSAGFGPGGGPFSTNFQGGLAAYASGAFGNCVPGNPPPVGAIYGNAEVFPLIGGSGGGSAPISGSNGGGGGGGGAGAILIATTTQILLPAGGAITANGGNGSTNAGSTSYGGGGSGGAIRLIAADSISGTGVVGAIGGTQQCGSNRAGPGRIRLETLALSVPVGTPPYSASVTVGPVFPDYELDAPTLRVTHVDSAAVTADPGAGITTPDVAIYTNTNSTISIEATSIPAGTTVQVRAVPERGAVITATSEPLIDAGGGVLTATATLTIPPGTTEIQLRANW